MPNSTLQAIQTKVRRITRCPSTSQLSDADLNNYINTFLLYNLPDQLRLFSLRTTFTFYTQPNVDEYETTTTDITSPFYQFKNKYIAIHQPVFFAGIQGFYTQERDVFYGYYPQTNTIADTQLRGNGTPGPFNGTIVAKPALQNNVIFSCNDTNGTAMTLKDYPFNNTLGVLGLPYDGTPVYGTVNYITGVYSVTFPANTAIGATLWVETIAYQPSKPLALLFFDEKFTVRPVPDKAYAIQLEADILPTELLNAGDEPFLNRAWEYISYGTSKKIFEDRLDYESINLIMPSLQEQEYLLQRSTLEQQAEQRTVTIYTQGKSYNYWGGWGPGGWPY